MNLKGASSFHRSDSELGCPPQPRIPVVPRYEAGRSSLLPPKPHLPAFVRPSALVGRFRSVGGCVAVWCRRTRAKPPKGVAPSSTT